MKRALGLILITAACIAGFLFMEGSQQGIAFIVIPFILLALFLFSHEISRGLRTLHRWIFSPVINEEKRINWMITSKIAATEEKMMATEEALGKFATAITDYAQHLSSHTSAIQGLNEASHELKKGAAEQNLALMRFMDNKEPPEPRRETPAWKIEPSTPAPEKRMFSFEEPATEPVSKMPEKDQTRFPPGCARNRQERDAAAHTARKEILYAIRHSGDKPYVQGHRPISTGTSAARREMPHAVNYLSGTRYVHGHRPIPPEPPAARTERPRGRQALVTEALAAEKEILGAINRLNNDLGESSPQV
jgi:hypothetical protein